MNKRFLIVAFLLTATGAGIGLGAEAIASAASVPAAHSTSVR